MRVPLRWLSEWIAVPVGPEALAEKLSLGGLEVEGIERHGPELAALRVGHVVAREPHPDADRLSVCRVDLGDGTLRQIVCGAPNVAAGQRVAVATPGTTLPDGTRLKAARIRGVASEGMICSSRELGLGDDHAGILVLDPAAPVGAPLDQVLRAGETVLDVSLTTNRGDCASLLGIAREVAAHFGGEVTSPPCAPPEAGEPTSAAIRVEIEDAEGCSLYVARVVRGVRVGPSPDWLRARLEAAGLRSIDVVVDVTNLVMLEFGQPLHAFDLGKLRGGVVRVRAAAAGERLRTLDGQERALEAEDLVIADAARVLAIAGVMGGADSEVDTRTRDVLIESAAFHPRRVRRTGRRLGLHSEAAYRFERGVDPEGVARAADRAARLLAELATGAVLGGRVEARGREPARVREIELDPGRVNRLLGSAFEPVEIAALLARVGVESRNAGGGLACTVPSWRHDLERPEDLVEEVGRIDGYEKLPALLPVARLTPVLRAPGLALAEALREALRACGFQEVMTLPFVPERDADGLRLAADDERRRAVRVRNPLVEEEPLLRTTLVPSLLRAAQLNFARQCDEVRVFEISRVFRARGAGELPDERWVAAALVARRELGGLWRGAADVPVFFEVKGAAERALSELGVASAVRSGPQEPYLHPGAACGLRAGERDVGAAGELHPDVAACFGIDRPCAVCELDLGALAQVPRETPRYREVSRHPSVRRDLAVLLDATTPAGEVLEAIRKTAGPVLASLEIFDRYQGRGVPEGRVSLAFRLVFQRLDRTLQEAEVNKTTERVVQMLGHRFGGALR
jgi:phenylalanyl-tRNA synthetase beta chain